MIRKILWKELLANGGGVVSDDLDVLREYILECMVSLSFAQEESIKAREVALEHFSFERYKRQWVKLLDIVKQGGWPDEMGRA